MVKQLSVFLENREGRIKDVLEILATNDINIVATSLADTSEYGMLRMIVSDPEKAQRVLKENYVSAMLTDVICIRVPHAVGVRSQYVPFLPQHAYVQALPHDVSWQRQPQRRVVLLPRQHVHEPSPPQWQ